MFRPDDTRRALQVRPPRQRALAIPCAARAIAAATSTAILAVTACAPVRPFDDPAAFPTYNQPDAAQLVTGAIRYMADPADLDHVDVLTTIAECDGPSGTFTTTVDAASGDRVRFHQVLADGQSSTSLVNGDVGWSRDPDTSAITPLDAANREMVRVHAFHENALHLDTAFTNHHLAGEALFAGYRCHTIDMLDELGKPAQAYINAENGRLEGLTLTDPTGRGAPTVTIFFDDWRDHDGLRLFSALTIVPGDKLWHYRFTDIRVNEESPSIFAVPPDLPAAPAGPEPATPAP